MATRLCAVVILCAFSVYLIGHCYGEHLIGDDSDKPCSYYDTVNLTGIEPLANGSYVYQDVVIPSNLVAYYNYEFLSWKERVQVKYHLRGCICLLKPCIKLCCPQGQSVKWKNGETSCVNVQQEINATVLVSNGTEKKAVDIHEFFVVQPHKPCDIMYQVVPQANDYDEFTLFENGSLRLEEDGYQVPRDLHCFNPHKLSANDSTYIMNPMNCMSGDTVKAKDIFYSYTMLFSIPFMILTIIVYMAVPELRNLHGKSLSCYLGCLVVGYSILSYILIKSPSNLSARTCALIGYPAYFFFMSSFFWLSVISFDLWWNFRGTRGINRLNERRRFLVYSGYTWGLASAFSLLTYLAQESDIPDHWKPGIGGDNFCWINAKIGWAGFIYFYGPILVIILLNCTLFILTSFKIYTVQKELARMVAKDDSQKNLRNEKDNVGLFLRLFIVMGVTWLTEVLSYIVGADSPYAYLFVVTDICNAIQGFIIFALFVLKKKVKYLILKRFGASNNLNSRASQCSSKTTTSSVLMHSKNSSDRPLIQNGLP